MRPRGTTLHYNEAAMKKAHGDVLAFLEAGYICARPLSQLHEPFCDARPDHTFGSSAASQPAFHRPLIRVRSSSNSGHDINQPTQ